MSNHESELLPRVNGIQAAFGIDVRMGVVPSLLECEVMPADTDAESRNNG